MAVLRESRNRTLVRRSKCINHGRPAACVIVSFTLRSNHQTSSVAPTSWAETNPQSTPRNRKYKWPCEKLFGRQARKMMLLGASKPIGRFRFGQQRRANGGVGGRNLAVAEISCGEVGSGKAVLGHRERGLAARSGRIPLPGLRFDGHRGDTTTVVGMGMFGVGLPVGCSLCSVASISSPPPTCRRRNDPGHAQ